MKFIGICGYANSGKDFLCSVLEDYYNGVRVSLGDFLKQKCKSECIKKFGIDPTDCSREDKNKIRDFLVSYANCLRTISSGTYFTGLADNRIENLSKSYDTFIIPDIRFDYYPRDEANWLLSKPESILIHIERNGVFAPNYSERINTPKVVRKAHLNVMPPNFVGEENKNKNFLDFLISSGTIKTINERLRISSTSKKL
jgi:hypothetical protein